MIVKRAPKRLDLKNIDLLYTLKVYGVSEEWFDEWVDEDTRADLIDGVMIVHSPASLWHDCLGNFVRGLMRTYAEEREQGRVFGPEGMVHLATCRLVCPDGFFVRRQRIPRRLPKQWEGTPDQVVEILSPSDKQQEIDAKIDEFMDVGVKQVWIVDPHDKTVTVYRPGQRARI